MCSVSDHPWGSNLCHVFHSLFRGGFSSFSTAIPTDNLLPRVEITFRVAPLGCRLQLPFAAGGWGGRGDGFGGVEWGLSADPVAFVADQRMRSSKGGGGVEGGSRIHTFEHDKWICVRNF